MQTARALCQSFIASCGAEPEEATPDASESVSTDFKNEFTLADHTRCVTFKTDRKVDVEGVMLLNKLYRSECKGVNSLQEFCFARSLDPEVQHYKPGIQWLHAVRQTERGPSLNVEDYCILGQGTIQKISQYVVDSGRTFQC